MISFTVGLDALAERALEIAELDDGDLGGLGALARTVGRDLDLLRAGHRRRARGGRRGFLGFSPSMYAKRSVRLLPCLAMSTASLARFGLRGQFGSFFAQPAILPMPQPHSQSRSFIACIAAVFCPAAIPSKLIPATPTRSADFSQPAGKSASLL